MPELNFLDNPPQSGYNQTIKCVEEEGFGTAPLRESAVGVSGWGVAAAVALEQGGDPSPREGEAAVPVFRVKEF